jgi:hypothetical protein
MKIYTRARLRSEALIATHAVEVLEWKVICLRLLANHPEDYADQPDILELETFLDSADARLDEIWALIHQLRERSERPLLQWFFDLFYNCTEATDAQIVHTVETTVSGELAGWLKLPGIVDIKGTLRGGRKWTKTSTPSRTDETST